MKTKLLFYLLQFSMLPWALGQYESRLDVNRINALISADGCLFLDETDPGSNTFTNTEGEVVDFFLYAHALWVSAIDPGGDLHLAAQTYRQTGTDFWAGPIANVYSAEYDERYARVWELQSDSIEMHKAHWADIGYTVPASIASWPGTGDILNGEAAILAPFFDFNNNGIYDPVSGDYPIIRGDEAIYFMYNDAREEHSETTTDPIGIEIHGMAYAYNYSDDPAVMQTIYLNYAIINRSEVTYEDVRVASFDDISPFGFSTAAKWGTNTGLNMAYVYADEIQPANLATGISLLNESLTSTILYNNDFTGQGNPIGANAYNRYMHGEFADGTPLTFGGSGYGGVTPTSFHFDGDPLVAGSWNMMDEMIEADKRILAAVGPYTWSPGDTLCLDFALSTVFQNEAIMIDSVLSEDYNLNAIVALTEQFTEIRSAYESEIEDCGITYKMNTESTLLSGHASLTGVQIYPIPTDNFFIMKTSETLGAEMVQIMDMKGRVVATHLVHTSNQVIDVTNLTPGCYLLQLTGKNELLTEMLIIR